jgi:hypothetical protein
MTNAITRKVHQAYSALALPFFFLRQRDETRRDETRQRNQTASFGYEFFMTSIRKQSFQPQKKLRDFGKAQSEVLRA